MKGRSSPQQDLRAQAVSLRSHLHTVQALRVPVHFFHYSDSAHF